MLNKEQHAAVMELTVSLASMGRKFSKEALASANQALQTILSIDAQARSNIGRAALGNQYNKSHDPEFQLTFRGTGGHKTLTGWEAMAKYLKVTVGSAQVRFSNAKGKLEMVHTNPDMGNAQDILTITHTNRRTRHGKRTPV